MLEIKSKLKIPRGAYKLEVKGQLKLPFDARQKSRLRTHLASGEEVALMLPRGEILRGGDLVVASDGRVVEVVAEPESVLHITCGNAQEITRTAYHLGNRHVPVQVGEGFLRITVIMCSKRWCGASGRRSSRCTRRSSPRPVLMAAGTATTTTSRAMPGASTSTATKHMSTITTTTTRMATCMVRSADTTLTNITATITTMATSTSERKAGR